MFICIILVSLYLYSIKKSLTEVFFEKLFLKMSQNSPENIGAGVSFDALLATSLK